MSFCPLCNGISDEYYQCSVCQGKMEDGGKIYDYYDDYSPYMEIDWNKLADGVPNSAGKPECVHLLVCPRCGNEQELTVHHK
ncbi:hypothetical protein [Siminovitchia sp. 179-K 8D1 HS]|uniref:hypothetical protein n=1 Tax=Siminovitchia sp. 179-K 8D1 HS TaxID=3142385 RepID=UPI00399F4008